MGVENPLAHDCVEKIRTAKSPEEAALIGRSKLRQQPELVCPLVSNNRTVFTSLLISEGCSVWDQ